MLSSLNKDFYTLFHKGLRAQAVTVLVQLGATDWDQEAARDQALCGLRDFIAVFRLHEALEDQWVHLAMEQRWATSAATTAADHARHACAMLELDEDIAMLEVAAPATALALGTRLYRRFALLIAELLEHMACEEVDNAAFLRAHFSGAEIGGMQRDALLGLPLQAQSSLLEWTWPALNAAERSYLQTWLRCCGVPGGARQEARRARAQAHCVKRPGATTYLGNCSW